MWSGSFDNLDLNDEHGRPIEYTVSQSEVDYYTHSQSGSANEWSWEFTNKPKYDGVDESGKPIKREYPP